MLWQWTPAAVLLFGLGLFCIASSILVLRRHAGVGAKTYACLMLALAIWQLAYAAELDAAELPLNLLFAQLSYIGITTVPVLWFTFALQYASRGRRPCFWSQIALHLVPLITLGIVTTSPYGGLVWRNIHMSTSGPFPMLAVDYGPWFWVHAAYSYAMMLGGSALIVYTVAKAPVAQRALKIVIQIVLATLLPFASNLLYLFGPASLTYVDLSPIALTISATWSMSVLLRQGLIPVLPLAHASLLQTMRDGVLILDKESRVVDANPAAERLLDRRAHEIIGQRAADVLAISESERHRLDTGQEQAKVSLIVAGKPISLEVHISPFSDPRGQAAGHTLVLYDTTERQRAQSEIERSLAQTTTLIENLPMGVMVQDDQAVIQFCNKIFCDLLELPWEVQTMVGRDAHQVCQELAGTVADSKPFIDQCWQACQQRLPVQGLEAQLGDGRTLECSGFPVEHGGVKSGYLWLWRDVSQQRAMARRSQDILRMEMVGRLAGGVAHEFNNLLTVINGYSDILRSQMEPGSQDYQDTTAIIEAGQRAADLTHQLLAYSRRQTLMVELFDLNDLLVKTTPMLRRLLDQQNTVTLTIVPAPAPIWVYADPQQITQVILQLATNAHDVMPQGGQLLVQARQINVSPEHAAALSVTPGPYGLLAVADTGPGLSPLAQEHLFEPFFTTKAVGEGTGLGLAMANGIVRQSHGAIEVHSVTGKGSTFRVLLPIATQEETSA